MARPAPRREEAALTSAAHRRRIRIRPAVYADAARIARVEVDTWRATYPGMVPDRVLLGMSYGRHEWSWRHFFRGAEARRTPAFVAELDGEVAGFGTCGRERTQDLGFAGEVFTLYVHPDQQGAGCGRGLMEAMFHRLGRGGMGSAIVWALAANPACYFYTALGGVPVAERTSLHWGEPLRERAFGWRSLDLKPR